MSEATSSPVGSTWEIKAKEAVQVTRPDGSDVTVVPVDGVALYVLDVPGEFVADVAGKATKVKAG